MFTDEMNTYVQHFLNEHRRLHRQLNAVRQALLKSQLPLPQIVEHLKRLRQELVHHFAEEENGGCTEEAVVRVPRLACEVELLQEEHNLLLGYLDELIARGETAGAGFSRAEYRREFEQFLNALRHHEVRENRLVQAGFNIDLELQERAVC